MLDWGAVNKHEVVGGSPVPWEVSKLLVGVTYTHALWLKAHAFFATGYAIGTVNSADGRAGKI